MAKGSQATSETGGESLNRVVVLARDIYLYRLSNPAYQAKTPEFRVEEAFNDAEAFWAEADKRS